MNEKPGLDYLGKVSGNTKNGINVHTISDNEVMVPKPVASSGNVISLKINLN